LNYVNAETVNVPEAYIQQIHIASPNPFSEYTRFVKPEHVPDHSLLKIYDLNGRLVNTFRFSGPEAVEWNGTDAGQNTLPGGMYLYIIDDKQSRVKLTGKILLKR
jgi:flagellar hook assembly protein FlgD